MLKKTKLPPYAAPRQNNDDHDGGADAWRPQPQSCPALLTRLFLPARLMLPALCEPAPSLIPAGCAHTLRVLRCALRTPAPQLLSPPPRPHWSWASPPSRPLQSYQVALVHLPQLLHIAHGHQAAVPHEPHSVQLKPRVQVLHHFPHRGLIETIAGEHMVGDRPAFHHHHPDHDLTIPGFAISAVAETSQLGRARPFEVGGGDVIERQVGLQAEQIPHL